MKHFFSLNFVLSTWVIGLYIGFYYISSPLENGVCRSPSHLNTTNLMRTLSAFLGESEVMLCACVESVSAGRQTLLDFEQWDGAVGVLSAYELPFLIKLFSKNLSSGFSNFSPRILKGLL